MPVSKHVSICEYHYVKSAVCGYTRTRGFTRPDPYLWVWVGMGQQSTVLIGSGRCVTGKPVLPVKYSQSVQPYGSSTYDLGESLTTFTCVVFHPNMDGSVVFTRLCQCAPHVTHASLRPPEYRTQMTSRSVQQFS